MKIFTNPRHQFVFFLLLFFVINIFQGVFTGLLEDEAYYWVWSLGVSGELYLMCFGLDMCLVLVCVGIGVLGALVHNL